MASEYPDAEAMTMAVSLALESAFDIEGRGVTVELIAGRRIRLTHGRDRFDVNVVKKR